MDANAQQGSPAGQTQLNDFGKLTVKFLKLGQNATDTLSQVFDEMSAKDWIRLVIIVGAYLLLRPYAQKWLGKKQVEQMQRDDKKAKAKISPNALRGEQWVEEEDEDEDDDDDEAEASGASWGEKARTRQRVMLKKLLEAEEKRKREEEEDDKDIEDLLED